MQVQSASERDAKPRGVVTPLLRLGAFAAVVFITLSVLTFRSVRAEMGELLSGAGEAIMRYPGAPPEGVRRLRFNGIDVSFRTQTVNAHLSEVLERYEALCDANSIAMESERGEDMGFVACLDVGDAPRTIPAVVDRLFRFSKTGDLRAVGDFRYVFAQTAGSEAQGQTFLLTAWSDSTLDLVQMLPRADVDAAGYDPAGVPRPVGLQRVLSASENGGPSGVFVYRVNADAVGGLQVFYRRELVRSGWAIVARHPTESIQIDEVHIISAERDGRLLTVLLRSGEVDRPVLTILTSETS